MKYTFDLKSAAGGFAALGLASWLAFSPETPNVYRCKIGDKNARIEVYSDRTLVEVGDDSLVLSGTYKPTKGFSDLKFKDKTGRRNLADYLQSIGNDTGAVSSLTQTTVDLLEAARKESLKKK